MPMSGVIRDTFDKDGGSIRGDDDFFSVARTTPFVAKKGEMSLQSHLTKAYRNLSNKHYL